MNGIISTEDPDEASLLKKVKQFSAMTGLDLASRGKLTVKSLQEYFPPD